VLLPALLTKLPQTEFARNVLKTALFAIKTEPALNAAKESSSSMDFALKSALMVLTKISTLKPASLVLVVAKSVLLSINVKNADPDFSLKTQLA
jgi:hypothetical protein